MPIKKAKKKENLNVAMNTVKFGRFGEEPKTVKVKEGATVKDVLAEVGIDIGTKEKIWVNGSKATLTTKVNANDIVAVVSPKEAGGR